MQRLVSMVLWGLALTAGGEAAAQNKVALVVGVSDYRVGGALPQTLVDAEKIGVALAAVGFQVDTLVKPALSKVELEEALLAFGERAERADVAALYFAGHGMQHGNDNWLIPASANLRSEAAVRFEGVALQNIMELMKSARFRIIILDACRNNPFKQNWPQTRSSAEGLSAVPLEAIPQGSLVAFSAAPNQKVPDDGVYADVLARWIKADGVELKQAMDRVRRDVQLRNPESDPEYVARYDGFLSFNVGRSKTTKVPSTTDDPSRIAFAAAQAGLSLAQREFEDCDRCPHMVALPTGSFTMGSPPGEVGRSDDEGPLRRVGIDYQLAVSKFEVTVAEWDLCVSDGDCSAAPDRASRPSSDRPVVFVSWHDARRYTSWLSRTSGQVYTLLSESEWEYASRAGGGAAWGHGISEAELSAYAWYSGEPATEPPPVGQKRANGFGLHDMHGGVAEWVEDCWASDYSAGQPSDGRPYVVENCRNRVLRGGSWLHEPSLVRSATRFMASATTMSNTFGFRVARRGYQPGVLDYPPQAQ